MFLKYIFIALLSVPAILIVDIGAAVIDDPFRVFHEPWARNGYFFRDLRKQAAGIINNHEFNSIILGTSMAENISSSDANAIFDADFVNISLSGGLLSERSLILARALKHKNLENVIMTMDGFAEYGSFHDDAPADSFAYLYNENRWDDLYLYLGFRYKEYLFCGNIVFRNICPGSRPLVSLTEWHSRPENQSRFGGLDNWLAQAENLQIKYALEEISQTISSPPKTMDSKRVAATKTNDIKVLKDYILRQIDAYPDTQFNLYFPPYSRITYALWAQSDPEEFAIYLNRIRLVTSAIAARPNAKIFGFEDLPFVDDIANYKDTRHHHHRFDRMILQWMKVGFGELTPETLPAYLADISSFARDFDLAGLNTQIETRLLEIDAK